MLSPGYAAVSGITGVTTTESQAQTLAPAAGFTASGLAVAASNTPGAGSSITVSLRADGADTGLSCTITAPATNCTNASASAAVAGGSAISLQVTSTGTILSTNLLVGFEAR